MLEHWLAELKRHLKKDERFFQQMDQQLGAALYKVVNTSTERFMLLPPHPHPFEIKTEGNYFRLEADLLHIDTAFPVEILWTQKDEQWIFIWADLPLEYLQETFANRNEWVSSLDYPFAIEAQNPVWPHIQLTFLLHASADPAQIEDKIYQWIHAWNKEQEKNAGGFIHNARRVSEPVGHELKILVDFGSAGIEGIHNLLSKLEEEGVLHKVIIGS